MEILGFIYDLFYNTDVLITRFYSWLHGLWDKLLPPIALDILLQFVIAVFVAVFIIINALFIIYLDRKVAARMQIRKGPNRVGPLGLFQTLADTFKLLSKEDIIPDKADKLLFRVAPVIMFLSTFLIFLVIPFGKGIMASDIDVGIVYLLAVSGLAVIGILVGGWASGNKYSFMGGMRSAAQIVGYEVPIALTVLSVVVLSGSLKVGDLVKAQPWFGFVVIQPVGFLLFIIASNAEINRAPFDFPEADSELVSGFITEFSAMRFAFFFLSEYTNLFLSGAIASALFLGGWQGPILPPIVWFMIKSYFVVFILMWIRWTFPRLRVDHLMEFSWKVLVPIALLNLVITAILAKVLQ